MAGSGRRTNEKRGWEKNYMKSRTLPKRGNGRQCCKKDEVKRGLKGVDQVLSRECDLGWNYVILSFKPIIYLIFLPLQKLRTATNNVNKDFKTIKII